MPQKKITINHSTGEITIEAIGYTGTTCLDATKVYEEKLGTIGERTRKPPIAQIEYQEFSQVQTTQQGL